jgi:hypothetical protein
VFVAPPKAAAAAAAKKPMTMAEKLKALTSQAINRKQGQVGRPLKG